MQIPLMPLHAVLFPGMPMPLAIFEERYLRMMEECQESHEPFGIALIRQGVEVGGLADPHRVGTVAEIVYCEEVGEGLQVMVVGRQRVRIRRLQDDDGLLRAEVELLEPNGPSLRASVELCRELAEMLEAHVRTVFELVGMPAADLTIPDDPARLSFMIAAHLTVPLREKQELLELDSVAERLVRERELLRRESDQYRLLLLARRKATQVQGGEASEPFLSAN